MASNDMTQEKVNLAEVIDAAGRQIPPLWPLESSVAVNPYIGQSNLRLAEAAAKLGRIGGGPVCMPRDWYAKRLATGQMSDADLEAALDASPYLEKPASLDALKTAMNTPRAADSVLPTIADLATEVSNRDWAILLADRMGHWGASYFDAGQALWIAPTGKTAWSAYRSYAIHDLTPEISGLTDFANFATDAPVTAAEAIVYFKDLLGLPEASLASYFHQLFLAMGGWAQMARFKLWQAELAGETDNTLTDLLAIRLLWEAALFMQFGEKVEKQTPGALEKLWAAHGQTPAPNADHIIDEILQEASEQAVQRHLQQIIIGESPDGEGSGATEERPQLQAAFCIDVRSEVFRRSLESLHPAIETLGFAGFFGMAIEHKQHASDLKERRMPALLHPRLQSCSVDQAGPDDKLARIKARTERAFGRFKLAAVSSFAFVEAMGPAYAAKLVRDALKRTKVTPLDPHRPQLTTELDLETRVTTAATILRAMSLTGNFARVVMLTGHGATVTNNPHASGLQCGACGGYSGDANARLLALLLNDADVRKGVSDKGIHIPDDTLFVAALHNTTTDEVVIFESDVDISSHTTDLAQVREWLKKATQLANMERAQRLPGCQKVSDIPSRAHDWSETRPELGLAGCQAFIIAPRKHTRLKDLAGRAFLNGYDWKKDAENNYAVLELLMTAPVVVSSWISLQYYGSTVSPQVFGSGNKLLHNVIGGFGVVEGNGGVLRSGLSWQSVHDGNDYLHEPLRLTVCIEAPIEAMTEILKKHDNVRALFDNGWLHLLAMNDKGKLAWRYDEHLNWIPLDGAEDSQADLQKAS